MSTASLPAPRTSADTLPVLPALDGVHPRRLGELVLAVQRLSLARRVTEVQDVVKHAARRLARADGASFVLRDGEMCFYVDEDAVSPLWKGRRFPMDTCVSGWSMRHRQSVSIDDVYADERVPQDAYRPTFVRSLLMTPIRSVDPVGAIGVYWASRHVVSDEERAVLRALADTTAVAVESALLWHELEDRVAERTAQLAEANAELAAEVAERRRAEQQVREMSLTDDLTGLRNRRGFLLLAGQSLSVEPRTREHGLVVVVDIDGLKAVNDSLGHAAGDELILAAAEVLRRSFRGRDVVGRVGGDEFAVYVPHTSDHAATVTARLAAETTHANASGELPSWLSLSVGVAEAEQDIPLEDLLRRADRRMYQHKKHRRSHVIATPR